MQMHSLLTAFALDHLSCNIASLQILFPYLSDYLPSPPSRNVSPMEVMSGLFSLPFYLQHLPKNWPWCSWTGAKPMPLHEWRQQEGGVNRREVSLGRHLHPSLGLCQQQRIPPDRLSEDSRPADPRDIQNLQDILKKSFWGLWRYPVCNFTSPLRVHRTLNAKLPFRKNPTKQRNKTSPQLVAMPSWTPIFLIFATSEKQEVVNGAGESKRHEARRSEVKFCLCNVLTQRLSNSFSLSLIFLFIKWYYWVWTLPTS